MARHRKPRRGVVLLLVLSLLVLFLLIGVTFLVVSGQYLRGAKAQARQGQRRNDPRGQLERVLYQLLRDTSIRSSIQGHSILEDLYGHDAIFDTLVADAVFEMPTPAPSSTDGGQFVRIIVAPSTTATPDYLNGRVLTMLSGPAANLTSRIVDYVPASGFIRVESFPSGQTGVSPLPLNGNTFLINGQPFNGTGAGFNPTTRNINRLKSLPGVPIGLMPQVALMPHFITYTTGADANQGPNGFSAHEGGADESYDAVDFQNMFLAMVPPDATNSNQIIPSFHRPALVNYWFNWIYTNLLDPIPLTSPIQQRATVLQPYGPDLKRQTADDPIDDNGTAVPINVLDTIVAMKRAFLFRPLSEDHPNFTGSNPSFTQLIGAGLSGLYDVDNDNDGVPDSIWIDAGLPVTTMPDGSLAKPMVAILIKDLDGRLNLNAHGNLAQLAPNYSSAVTGNFAGGVINPSSPTLPRGRGYGPADVFLGHIFSTTAEHTAILQGRYGLDGRPGESGVNDDISKLRPLGIPAIYSTQVSAYASPPDVWGRDAVALDLVGQPLFASMVDTLIGEPDSTVDGPYEMNLSWPSLSDPGVVDLPYNLAELEPLLRPFDGDVNTLPSRIVDAARTALNDPTNGLRYRSLFTVDSRDIPVGSQYEPVEMRGSFSVTGSTILDLYVKKLIAGGVATANIPAELDKIVPWEIRRGGRFNINRLLGDGRDNNGNGVVDEPSEATSSELIWNSLGLSADFYEFESAKFDHTNDDNLTKNRQFARQLYARHLFCLMMTLVDNGYVEPGRPPEYQGMLTAAQSTELQKLTARRIAQWAINVVDFRDPDAIMTPFEYDWRPFNGWNVDGWIGDNPGPDNTPGTADDTNDEGHSDRGLVWGCEYPDLMIAESVAFHDRRVKDTSVNKKRVDGTMEGDPSLDQYRIPQGSLFLEFYCPRGRYENNPNAPEELYTVDRTNGVVSLDLGRMAPVHPTTMRRYPVWRVAISEAHHAGTTKNSMSPHEMRGTNPSTISLQPWDMSSLTWTGNTNPSGPDLDIERYVWFANVDPTTVNLPASEARVTYYNRQANPLLEAGDYAVVGPRIVTYVGSQKPSDPNKAPPDFLPSLQKLTLNSSLAAGVLTWVNNGNVGDPASTLDLTRAQKALPIIAAANAPSNWTDSGNTADIGFGNTNVGIGISGTEPLPIAGQYYKEPNANLNATGFPKDSYTPFENTPFDKSGPLGNGNLLRTGTTDNYKTAFLQRLANPLESYDPVSNPYITIDWSSIDVTVFSGEEDTDQRFTYDDINGNPKKWWIDPDDKDPFDKKPADDVDKPATDGPPEMFDTRERSGSSFNLWSQTTQAPNVTVAAVAVPALKDYFPHNLKHTLGFLNATFGVGRTGPSIYKGSPSSPFPWLTWNNRPFDTPFELMFVPATGPSRLLHDFEMAPATSPPNPYNSSGGFVTARAPFRHLLNFFHTSSTAGDSPHFYRLFDYIETPSPFVGTEKWYNPDDDNTPYTHFGDTANAAGAGFRPPYNRLSRFRDPGRVNINTIFDPLIWQGIMGGLDLSPSFNAITNWNKVVLSRQGYGTTPGIDSASPTRFAGPFRSATSGYLAPIPALAKDGVQATLLRSSPSNAAQPLFDFSSTSAHQHTNRNPYFRYQGISRLGNLITTRSNVFAIWITVGYFEVEAVAVDAVHPEGFEFGQEAGILTGNVRRHRLFSIVDRSIPVAYERGENHNIDRAILVRRLIE